MNDKEIPPEIAGAYREAKARGLPDGWSCTIDKRNRRKWTAPNGRSCDSIPKALQISVELGLLPSDFVVISGKRKRSAKGQAESSKASKGHHRPSTTAAATQASNQTKHTGSSSHGVEKRHPEDTSDHYAYLDDAPEERGPPPEPMDPEHSLDVTVSTKKVAAPATTVHWDPDSPDGRKVGWKIKIALSGDNWFDGRIVRYDPYTHKHKIALDREEGKEDKNHGGNEHTESDDAAWIWLRNEQHNLQVATRIVWAHVKGYAWWPALVMESNMREDRRDGYVHVEFFGSGEVSVLRDSPESVRDFTPDAIDPVVAKHKKKRNAKAYSLACNECQLVRNVRNEAAVFYAEKAMLMANAHANAAMKSNNKGTGSLGGLVGKSIKIHRSDVNYPYGDTLTGTVRAFSSFQKKWLVSFEISEQTKAKYEAAWINVLAKDCSLRVLDKAKKSFDTEDLVPYLYGFNTIPAGKLDPQHAKSRDADLCKLLTERCHGCVEYRKPDDIQCVCKECSSVFHLSCLDPPISLDTWIRMQKDNTPFVCSRCTPCRGCYQKDVAFGCHVHPLPPTLSFPNSETLNLCAMCKEAYDAERFCPNCAHSWDDKKFDKVRQQLEFVTTKKKRKGGTTLIQDTASPLVFGSFSGDEILPLGAKVDPMLFYPETSNWGYTEVEMLVCDACKVWVHAGCAGITEDEYDTISDGDHPIHSREFLCRVCCRKRCKDLISALQQEDRTGLFAVPVSEKVAPNYRDIIKNPMDLFTMLERAESEEYQNYAWVRDMFELMVLNALTFNRMYTRVWIEVKRFYEDCLKSIFVKMGKAAPPGKCCKDIEKNFVKAEVLRKQEEDRVQIDEAVEKKDLVAGLMATTITLPKLRDSPPDEKSCVPFREVKMQSVDAFYCSWMDCCYTCGSSGASDTMLFCVDCGEAFHSFCANAPVHSMEASSVAGWRCPNCKICEISGDVPADETKMLFCEMCDRAFTLDLLDPPLKSAPSGLWICGQCVECKCCNQALDPRGASLTHWSRQPEVCFRCGGCDGLLDESYQCMSCKVCEKLLRSDDEHIIRCVDCGAHVHASCEVRALQAEAQTEALKKLATRTQKAENVKYQCLSCFEPLVVDADRIALQQKFLRKVAWESVVKGTIAPNDQISPFEIFEKLLDEVDWKVRELWFNDYLSVIQEAFLLYRSASERHSDARLVVQHVLGNEPDIPLWMAQRALRFILVVRRSKWESVDDIILNQIDACVVAAKLAASFLRTICSTMGVDIEKNISCYKRVSVLLDPPNGNGTAAYPVDIIEGVYDDTLEQACKLAANENVSESDINVAEMKFSSMQPLRSSHPVTLPSPLCGWKHIAQLAAQMEWKDPRECSLCHLCGDDDAGFHDAACSEADGDEYPLPKLGRLLPMANGFWVHTLCALWSSEVWEAANDGLIHAVERARARGAQLKCFGCGRPGATVGCNKSNCSFNYHFPCAKACGAAFTADQQVYCKNHRSSATRLLSKEGFEFMKALMVAPEKKAVATERDHNAEAMDDDLCSRVGCFVLHSLGKIEQHHEGFHSENYLMPPGYTATRIFWSTVLPRSRTVYILKIEKSSDNRPEFSILPSDSPEAKICGTTVGTVYGILMDRVRKVNFDHFSDGELYSKLPIVRRTRRNTFGLNGPQFFGFGLNHIRRMLEARPGAEAATAPLNPSSPNYRFCYTQPTIEAILDLQRKRAAAKAEQALENSTGCARTEGMNAFARSGGSGRITRALVRSAEEDAADAGSSSATNKKSEEKAQADRSLNQVKYRRMKAVPIEQRLVARRSHIHGWGLFTKSDIQKDDPIIEYMGEVIRQPIADQRERAYEISGEGSCYMFRLDMQRIVDATKIGCMARFMNHCCGPNAYAKIISVDAELGQDRKIVVFANRDISAGEEITYDYKFPVEDGSLRCTCGAPNCIGRLN